MPERPVQGSQPLPPAWATSGAAERPVTSFSPRLAPLFPRSVSHGLPWKDEESEAQPELMATWEPCPCPRPGLRFQASPPCPTPPSTLAVCPPPPVSSPCYLLLSSAPWLCATVPIKCHLQSLTTSPRLLTPLLTKSSHGVTLLLLS
jgi:hypothetical protein